MSDRTRRAFLALGLGAVTTVAGCAGDTASNEPPGADTTSDETTSDDETPSDDGTTPTDTTNAPERASYAFNHARSLHRLDAGFPQRDVASYYLALLRTEEHASAFPSGDFDNAEAEQFLSGTDFSQSVVVVIQDRRGSSYPNLQLRETGREGRQVTVEAEYPGNQATSDITTDTLLVRIPTSEPVRGAHVRITPMYGNPVQFSTANVYDVVPMFGDPGDLVVRNLDCSAHSLPVTVTHQGDLLFRERLTIGPATSQRIQDVVTYPGEWTLTVSRDHGAVSQTWNVTDTPPGDLLVDVAGDGTVSLSQPPGTIEGVDPGTCETDGVPYESSSPDENLDDPVDLWVVDRGAGPSELTVTIRDGETDVFTRTFETTSGEDKLRRSGLLAKKTTYTVTVTAEDGRSVTKTVTVADGSDQLLVRVSETGELMVSLE